MITEDYVSFEIAKLLKEKGFVCYYHYYYDKDGDLLFSGCRVDTGKNEFVAPTLQMAMKWLRDEKGLYINVWAEPKDFESNDFSTIYRMHVYNGASNSGTREFSKYEEACEAAIKYCLENLI